MERLPRPTLVDEVGPESCPAGRSSLHDGCLGESEFFDVLECVLVLREVDERVGDAYVFEFCHGVSHIVTFSICVDRYLFAHDVLFLSTNNFFAFWREKSIATGSAEVPGRGIPERSEDMPRKPGTQARRELR